MRIEDGANITLLRSAYWLAGKAGGEVLMYRAGLQPDLVRWMALAKHSNPVFRAGTDAGPGADLKLTDRERPARY